MSEENKKASLANLKDGAIVEMFDRCMNEVLSNIEDPNTEPTQKREINLKVTFQATDDRSLIGIQASCNSKLKGQISITTSGILRDGIIVESKPRQQPIFNNLHKIERANS